MIENTEAGIVSILGKQSGRITKLSGLIGEEYIRLYNAKFNLGFSFSITSTFNNISFSSNHPMTPLNEGDEIYFTFTDGNIVKISLPIKGMKSDNCRKNFAVITDVQLNHFLSHQLKTITANCHKYESRTEFFYRGNELYQCETDGMKLVQIVAKRVVGVKYLIQKTR